MASRLSAVCRACSLPSAGSGRRHPTGWLLSLVMAAAALAGASELEVRIELPDKLPNGWYECPAKGYLMVLSNDPRRHGQPGCEAICAPRCNGSAAITFRYPQQTMPANVPGFRQVQFHHRDAQYKSTGTFNDAGSDHVPFRLDLYRVEITPEGAMDINAQGGPQHFDDIQAILDTLRIATTASTPEARLFALCEEALKAFSPDDLRRLGFSKSCNIRKGHAEILADFELAIAKFDRKYAGSGKKTFVSAPRVGGFRAINWVGNEGGLWGATTPGYYLGGESLAREFVFESPPNVKRDMARADLAQKGTEPALYRAITTEADRLGRPGEPRRLTLGEIFYLALEQRNGDAREAMLLAHNTMRSLARGDFAEGKVSDPELTGLFRQPGFFDRYVEEIRGDHADVEVLRDKGGPVYHVFGTAFFEMQMQGDLGGLPNLLAAFDIANAEVDPGEIGQGKLLVPWIRGSLGKAIEQPFAPETAASRVANALEQLLRWKAGKPADPEKFCFNVWGARIGARLWSELGGSVITSPLGSPGAPHERRDPAYAAVAQIGYQETTPETYKAAKPIVELYRCPISVTWEGEGGRLSFDQQGHGLHGSYPGLLVVPVPDRPGESWGALVFDYSRQPHREMVRATGGGKVSMLRIDLQTKRAAVYAMTVTAGEAYTMRVTPDVVGPDLVRSDGVSVRPTLVAIGAPGAAPAEAREPAPREPAPPITRRTPAQELAAARAAYEAAFEKYTKLVTEGGEGNVEQARKEYIEAHQRFKELQARQH